MTTTGNIYIWVNIIAGTMSWLLSSTWPETGGASSSMAGAFSSSSLSLSLIIWILFLFLESSYLDWSLALFVFSLDWTRRLVLSASLLGYCWCVCLQGRGCGPPWSWLPRTWCNCRGSGTSRRRNTSLRERELRTGSFRNLKFQLNGWLADFDHLWAAWLGVDTFGVLLIMTLQKQSNWLTLEIGGIFGTFHFLVLSFSFLFMLTLNLRPAWLLWNNSNPPMFHRCKMQVE